MRSLAKALPLLVLALGAASSVRADELQDYLGGDDAAAERLLARDEAGLAASLGSELRSSRHATHPRARRLLDRLEEKRGSERRTPRLALAAHDDPACVLEALAGHDRALLRDRAAARKSSDLAWTILAAITSDHVEAREAACKLLAAAADATVSLERASWSGALESKLGFGHLDDALAAITIYREGGRAEDCIARITSTSTDAQLAAERATFALAAGRLRATGPEGTRLASELEQRLLDSIHPRPLPGAVAELLSDLVKRGLSPQVQALALDASPEGRSRAIVRCEGASRIYGEGDALIDAKGVAFGVKVVKVDRGGVTFGASGAEFRVLIDLP